MAATATPRGVPATQVRSGSHGLGSIGATLRWNHSKAGTATNHVMADYQAIWAVEHIPSDMASSDASSHLRNNTPEKASGLSSSPHPSRGIARTIVPNTSHGTPASRRL